MIKNLSKISIAECLFLTSGCTNPDGSTDVAGTVGLGLLAAGAVAFLSLDDDDSSDYSSHYNDRYKNRNDYRYNNRHQQPRYDNRQDHYVLHSGCNARYGGSHNHEWRQYMNGERSAAWKDGCAQVYSNNTRDRRAWESRR